MNDATEGPDEVPSSTSRNHESTGVFDQASGTLNHSEHRPSHVGSSSGPQIFRPSHFHHPTTEVIDQDFGALYQSLHIPGHVGGTGLQYLRSALFQGPTTTGVFNQDSGALYHSQYVPLPRAVGGIGPTQGITLGIPPPPYSTRNLQVINISIPTADGQFRPFGAPGSTGDQPLMMPAYITYSSPQVQQYEQNSPFQRVANPPLQHIVISVPAGSLPDSSNNLGMISSYPPPPATFQTFLPGLTPTALPIPHSVLSSIQNFSGGNTQDTDPIQRGTFEPTSLSHQQRGNRKKRQARRDGLISIVKERSKTDRRYRKVIPGGEAASVCEDSKPSKLTGVGPITLYTENDKNHLSEYQCCVRKLIEFFETEDLDSVIRGAVLAQVGIRCHYCSVTPEPEHRLLGAVYYTANLDGLYLACQNMSKNHLSRCAAVPKELRRELFLLKEMKQRAIGGKKYWAEAAIAVGVIEESYGLRFKEKDDIAKDQVK